jgi:predicted dehydrogenase
MTVTGKKTSLIVGMGIGQLYKQVLLELGHEVVTVDSNIAKNADFPDIKSALFSRVKFDTVHICTPNWTHIELATILAPFSGIIFIEKPGVRTSKEWINLAYAFPMTRFMMVKNNMWRNNIKEFQDRAANANTIKLNWINKDRIPSPGSWFTNKKLAFGGVSRDLMPHLLSLFIALNPSNYKRLLISNKSSATNWSLENLNSTEYGSVDKNGVYDVDDLCQISFKDGDKSWELTANWKSDNEDDRAIHFNTDQLTFSIELGLCPEDAYKRMIQDAIEHFYDADFWKTQLEYDSWIHERMEEF